MALDTAQVARFGMGWAALAAYPHTGGSAHHPYVARLSRAGAVTRDLADAIHALVMLHGRQPGVLEHAASRNLDPAWRGWFENAAEAFAGERALIARLASGAGPLPSTPGQAESEAAIAAQRHALDTLARSDRAGCAIGTSIALVIEWQAIRGVLETAAERFGVTARASTLPAESEAATIVAAMPGLPATERALNFGSEQLVGLHRALWDLLEARASARDRA